MQNIHFFDNFPLINIILQFFSNCKQIEKVFAIFQFIEVFTKKILLNPNNERNQNRIDCVLNALQIILKQI